MKTIITTLALAIAATSVQADTKGMTNKEATMHRIQFCESISQWREEAKAIGIDLTTRTHIRSMVRIIKQNEDNPYNYIVINGENDRFYQKARADIDVARFTGKLVLTKESYTDCHSDLVKILEDSYIPNYTYMEESK